MTWDDVECLVLTRWPGHKWEDCRLDGYIGELTIDLRTPDRAVLGLRSVVSNGFVPSVDQVREAARKAMGPPTAMDIAAAERRQRELRAANASTRHLNAA